MNLRLTLLLALTSVGRAIAADATAPAPAPTVPVPVPAATQPEAPRGAPRPAAATPAAPAPAAARTESSVAPTVTFDTFRLITDNNIFNPNRTGRRDRSESAPAPRTDILTLVGTMDSEKGQRAFFDGSDASYRKVLHVGDSVDKFKVTKIEPKVVQLERDGKTIPVNVGQQFRRPEGADWTLAADTQPRAGMMASPSRPDPNAPPEIPANVSDAERNLRERRAKSLRN